MNTKQADQPKQTGNNSNVKRNLKNELQKAENGQITPIELLEKAIAQNLDVDKLEKLMELQIRYEERQARMAFVEAMSQFRAECPDIYKTKKGHNSSYAPLYQIVDSIKNLEYKYGLTHVWKTEQSETGIKVICRITHIGGHYEETFMVAGADKTGSKNDIQAIGSTISYLERYTLCALFGIATQDMDNDGGSGPQQPKSQKSLIDALIEEAWRDYQKENQKVLSAGESLNHEKFILELRNQYKRLSEVKREEFQWTRDNINVLIEKINIKAIIENGKEKAG